MGGVKENGGAAPTAPAGFARFLNQASPYYPAACTGSIGLAAYFLGLRFGVSPNLAPTLAELAGYRVQP